MRRPPGPITVRVAKSQRRTGARRRRRVGGGLALVGRRQPDQPDGGVVDAEPVGLARRRRRHRHGSRGDVSADVLRPRVHGLPHAGDGRIPGHRGDSPVGGRQQPPRADHRHHGQRAAGGTGAVSERRDGRLRRQADPSARPGARLATQWAHRPASGSRWAPIAFLRRANLLFLRLAQLDLHPLESPFSRAIWASSAFCCSTSAPADGSASPSATQLHRALLGGLAPRACLALHHLHQLFQLLRVCARSGDLCT